MHNISRYKQVNSRTMQWFLLLLSVVLTRAMDRATLDLVTPLKEYGEACGYDSCTPPRPGMINVHLVPHTHLELGYTRTFYQHYSGHDDIYDKSDINVKRILDYTITELWANSERKFTFADMPYLFYWWSQRDGTVRRMVYQLLRQGRLYFVGGGWGMNDEATTSYHAIIDVFTYSLRKLNMTFLECARPLVAWQSDVFGHSREFASLAAQMGFDALFINPMGLGDELARMKRRAMEFVWRGSDDLGPSSDMFTHKLFDGYWSPPGFCFSSTCSDPLIITSDSVMSNAEDRAELFIESIMYRQAPHYGDHLMVMMGQLLGYFDAGMWFGNIEKLISLVNERGYKRKKKIHLLYSTPACYLKAVHESNATYETKQDDFYPMAYDKDSYLAGLYTSRPSMKLLAREGLVYLQIAKQLQVLAKLGNNNNAKIFEQLNWIVGAFQDHNIITGASRDYVRNDYISKMDVAIQKSTLLLKQAFNKLRKSPKGTLYYRCAFNSSSCDNARGDNVIIMVYNPLSWNVTMAVRIPTNTRPRAVYGPDGTKIPSVLLKVAYPILQLPRQSVSEHELVFIAKNIPPLGYTSYFVQRVAAVETLEMATTTATAVLSEDLETSSTEQPSTTEEYTTESQNATDSTIKNKVKRNIITLENDTESSVPTKEPCEDKRINKTIEEKQKTNELKDVKKVQVKPYLIVKPTENKTIRQRTLKIPQRKLNSTTFFQTEPYENFTEDFVYSFTKEFKKVMKEIIKNNTNLTAPVDGIQDKNNTVLETTFLNDTNKQSDAENGDTVKGIMRGMLKKIKQKNLGKKYFVRQISPKAGMRLNDMPDYEYFDDAIFHTEEPEVKTTKIHNTTPPTEVSKAPLSYGKEMMRSVEETVDDGDNDQDNEIVNQTTTEQPAKPTGPHSTENYRRTFEPLRTNNKVPKYEHLANFISKMPQNQQPVYNEPLQGYHRREPVITNNNNIMPDYGNIAYNPRLSQNQQANYNYNPMWSQNQQDKSNQQFSDYGNFAYNNPRLSQNPQASHKYIPRLPQNQLPAYNQQFSDYGSLAHNPRLSQNERENYNYNSRIPQNQQLKSNQPFSDYGSLANNPRLSQNEQGSYNSRMPQHHQAKFYQPFSDYGNFANYNSRLSQNPQTNYNYNPRMRQNQQLKSNQLSPDYGNFAYDPRLSQNQRPTYNQPFPDYGHFANNPRLSQNQQTNYNESFPENYRRNEAFNVPDYGNFGYDEGQPEHQFKPINPVHFIYNNYDNESIMAYGTESTPKSNVDEEMLKQETRRKNDLLSEILSEDLFIKNKYVTITIDPVSRKIDSLALSNGVKIPLDLQFYYYISDDPDYFNKTDVRAPGVYIFRTTDNEPVGIIDFIDTMVYKTALVEEIHCRYSEYASLVVRLYEESPIAEVDWIVGPIPVNDGAGKDVFIRYLTDLKNNGVFYTDSNGRQTIKRIRHARPMFEAVNKDAVAGNYYPVTSKIYIEDLIKNLRFSVFNDRAQGGTSLYDGEIDLMLHRRLLTDDTGINCILNDLENNEGVRIRGKHYLYLSKADFKMNKIFEKKFAKEIELKPQVLVTTASPYGKNSFAKWSKHVNKISFLKSKLPVGVHLLTLEPWNDGTILLRFENYLEKADTLKSGIKIVFPKEIFTNILIKNMRETTLAANIWLSDHKPLQWKKKNKFYKDFNTYYGGEKVEYVDDEILKKFQQVNLDAGIQLKPQQIRTFVCTFNYM